MIKRRKRVIKYRAKVTNGVLRAGFSEFYRMYYNRTKTHIPRRKISKIMRRIAELVWPKVIKEYYRWRFPYRLGSFYISEGSKLSTYSYRDWARYRKTNVLKRNVNYSLDGRKPYIKHGKLTRGAANSTFYRFKPCRGDASKITGHRGLWAYINSLDTEPYRPHLY